MKRADAVDLYHRGSGWVWVALVLPALLWWKDSVPFLVFISLYANIAASFANRLSDKDIDRIVNKMLERDHA